MDEVTVERALRAVECVPSGRVVCYGDIAALVGIGPRQVGAIMRAWGANVAWWRVTSRDGDLAGELLNRARSHWEVEGIAVKPNGRGCWFGLYRADLPAWEAAYRMAVADLDTGDAEDQVDTAG